ncbi:unnamed protein product, partial [Didymodactylos carnosus]
MRSIRNVKTTGTIRYAKAVGSKGIV